MTSGKIFVILTLLFVLLMFTGGIYFPNTIEMSLADTSFAYTILRAGIIALLISILVTKPPRSLALRGMIGSWSFLLFVQAVEALLSYELRLLDGIVFIKVAIILAIEALETTQIPVSKKYSPPKRIPVTSS